MNFEFQYSLTGIPLWRVETEKGIIIIKIDAQYVLFKIFNIVYLFIKLKY